MKRRWKFAIAGSAVIVPLLLFLGFALVLNRIALERMPADWRAANVEQEHEEIAKLLGDYREKQGTYPLPQKYPLNYLPGWSYHIVRPPGYSKEGHPVRVSTEHFGKFSGTRHGDLLSLRPGLPYIYYTSKDRWILISAYLDRTYDTEPAAALADPAIRAATQYDPTNGYLSDGDFITVGGSEGVVFTRSERSMKESEAEAGTTQALEVSK